MGSVVRRLFATGRSLPHRGSLPDVLRGAAVLLVFTASGAAAGELSSEVYVSTGEHGEPSFSDVAAPDARRVDLVTAAPADDPAAELERRIEQNLAVAEALEASRLARESARAEARAAAAAARAESEPEVIHQDRYVSAPYLLQGAYGRDRFRHGFDRHRRDGRFDDRFDGRSKGRPDGGRHGRERTISKQFLYDPD